MTTTYNYHAGKDDADEDNLQPHSIFQIEQAPRVVVKIQFISLSGGWGTEAL